MSKKKLYISLKSILWISILSTQSLTTVNAAKIDFEKNSPYDIKNIFNPIQDDWQMLEEREQQKKMQNYVFILRLLQQNKINKAESELKKSLVIYSHDVDFINLSALLNISKNDKDKAKELYHEVLSQDKHNKIALLGLAKLYLEMDKLKLATSFAEKSIKVNSNSVAAYLTMAESLYKQNKLKQAENTLLNAVKNFKDTHDVKKEVRIILVLAQFYNTESSKHKLILLVDSLIKRYPDNNLALSVLANTQIITQQTKLAAQTLQKIINSNKKDINHRLMLAELWVENPDRYNQSLKLLNEILTINPKYQKAIILKSNTLIAQGKLTEASKFAENIKDKFPDVLLAYILQADVSFAKHDLDKAYNQYATAYGLMPVTKVLNKMVDIRYDQKRYEEAITLLKKEATRRDVDRISINLKLAEILLKLNKKQEAIRVYENILQQTEYNLTALNNLAWIYIDQGLLEKSRPLITTAYQQAPTSPAILDTYAYQFLKQGDSQAALKILKPLVRSYDNLYDAKLHFAEALLLQGKKKMALELLNDIIRKNKPDSNVSQQAASLISKINSQRAINPR